MVEEFSEDDGLLGFLWIGIKGSMVSEIIVMKIILM